MAATITDELSARISEGSSEIELMSKRLIWALKGFGERLHRFCLCMCACARESVGARVRIVQVYGCVPVTRTQIKFDCNQISIM